MILYNNKEIDFNGCPGCAYAKGEFALDAGMVYENENFTLSQDWELPIKGFMFVSPKRHVETLSELTDEERYEMFTIVNTTVNYLRKNKVCDNYNYVIEEKPGRHLHVWIMPRYKWMEDVSKGIIKNIGDIFTFAKENFRNKENYQEIDNVSRTLRKEFECNK